MEDRLKQYRPVISILSVLIVEALGFLVGMMTRSGTKLYAESIVKPPLAPPGILFPIAWTLLYCFMGIGIGRVITTSVPSVSGDSAETAVTGNKKKALILFIVQLALNLLWCFIFFGAMNYVAALVELILMLIAVIMMTLTFRKVDKIAGLLQIPYILWLCFATYLNIGVIIFN